MSKSKNLLQTIGAGLVRAVGAVKQKFVRSGESGDAGQQSVLGERAPTPLIFLGHMSEKMQYRVVIGAALFFLVLSIGTAYVATELDGRVQTIRSDLDDIAQVVQQLRGEVQGAAAGNTDSATDIDDHYASLMQKVADLTPWTQLREIRTNSLPESNTEARWSDPIWRMMVGDAVDLAPRLEGVLATLDEFSKVVAVGPQFGAMSLMSREMVDITQRASTFAEESHQTKAGVSESTALVVRDVHEKAQEFASSGGNAVDLAALNTSIERAIGKLESAAKSTDRDRLDTIFKAKIAPLYGVMETTFRQVSQDLGLEFSRASDNAAKATAEVSKPLPTLGGIVAMWAVAGALFLAGLAGVAVLMAINAKASEFAAYYAKRERDETDERVLEIMRELSPIATGDLTKSLTVTEHVTGSISDRVNQVIGAIRNVLEDLRSSTTKVEGAIEDMFMQSEAAQRITKDATDQASASRHASEKGEAAVNDAVSRSNEQRGMMQEVSKSVKRLGEIFQSVLGVVDVLDSVSSYSEVLAINTSLKAEEAGEHGGAFRVIAEEQRKLTDDTKRRLNDVTVLVQNMLGETQAVIQTVERVTASMVASSETWESVTSSLQEIRGAAQAMEKLMSNVDSTANEQGKSASNAVKVMGALADSASRFKTSNDGLIAAAA